MQTSLSSRCLRSIAAASLGLLGGVALLGLAGCFDNDPGLQERLVRSQAEVQDKARRIQELETALEQARTRPAPPASDTASSSPAQASTATPALLTKEQMEETYVASAKAMRQRVESELTGYAVENCTLFKVDMPSVALPYTSKVALNLRSNSGQPYRLEFPVGADWSGKWTFPATADVLATLEKSQAQAVAAPPRTTGGGSSPRGGPAAGGPSSSTAGARPTGRYGEGPATTSVETIEMTWGRNRSPGVAAPRRPTETAPDAPATPQAPRVSSAPQTPPPGSNAGPGPNAAPPRPAMQSERDVLIQF